MRPSLTAIVTAHKATPFAIMSCLANQTVPPQEVLVGLSDFPLPWVVPSLPFPFTVAVSKNENDFGYRKRNRLINVATKDFVGFFCHDDSYDADYIEKMLDALMLTRADVAYCSWNDIPDCKFEPCSSTLGNFFVRRTLLQEIGGFPSHKNEGMRDAALIEEIRNRVTKIARVNVTLYQHNRPYDPTIRPSVWGIVQE